MQQDMTRYLVQVLIEVMEHLVTGDSAAAALLKVLPGMPLADIRSLNQIAESTDMTRLIGEWPTLSLREKIRYMAGIVQDFQRRQHMEN